MFFVGWSQVVRILALGQALPNAYTTDYANGIGELRQVWAEIAPLVKDLGTDLEAAVGDVPAAYEGAGSEAFVNSMKSLLRGSSAPDSVADSINRFAAWQGDEQDSVRLAGDSEVAIAAQTLWMAIRAVLALSSTLFGDAAIPGVLALIFLLGKKGVWAVALKLAEKLAEDGAEAEAGRVVSLLVKLGSIAGLLGSKAAFRVALQGLLGAGFEALLEEKDDGSINPGKVVESGASWAGGALFGEATGGLLKKVWTPETLAGTLGFGLITGTGYSLGMSAGNITAQVGAQLVDTGHIEPGKLSNPLTLQSLAQGAAFGGLGAGNMYSEIRGMRTAGSDGAAAGQVPVDGTVPKPADGTVPTPAGSDGSRMVPMFDRGDHVDAANGNGSGAGVAGADGFTGRNGTSDETGAPSEGAGRDGAANSADRSTTPTVADKNGASSASREAGSADPSVGARKGVSSSENAPRAGDAETAASGKESGKPVSPRAGDANGSARAATEQNGSAPREGATESGLAAGHSGTAGPGRTAETLTNDGTDSRATDIGVAQDNSAKMPESDSVKAPGPVVDRSGEQATEQPQATAADGQGASVGHEGSDSVSDVTGDGANLAGVVQDSPDVVFADGAGARVQETEQVVGQARVDYQGTVDAAVADQVGDLRQQAEAEGKPFDPNVAEVQAQVRAADDPEVLRASTSLRRAESEYRSAVAEHDTARARKPDIEETPEHSAGRASEEPGDGHEATLDAGPSEGRSARSADDAGAKPGAEEGGKYAGASGDPARQGETTSESATEGARPVDAHKEPLSEGLRDKLSALVHSAAREAGRRAKAEAAARDLLEVGESRHPGDTLTMSEAWRYRRAAIRVLDYYRSGEVRGTMAALSGDELAETLRGGTELESSLAMIETVRRATISPEIPDGKILRSNQLTAVFGGADGVMLQMRTAQGKTFVSLALALRVASRDGVVQVITSNETLADRALSEEGFAAAGKLLDYRVVRWDPHESLDESAKPTIILMTHDENMTSRLYGNDPPGRFAIIDEADRVLYYNDTPHYLREGSGMDQQSPHADAWKAMREFFVEHKDPEADGSGWTDKDFGITERTFGRLDDLRSGHTEVTGDTVARAARLWGAEKYGDPDREFTASEKNMFIRTAEAEYMVPERQYGVHTNPAGKKLIELLDVDGKPLRDPMRSSQSEWQDGLQQAVQAKHDAFITMEGDLARTRVMTNEQCYSSENYDTVAAMSGTLEGAAGDAIAEKYPVNGFMRIKDHFASRLDSERAVWKTDQEMYADTLRAVMEAHHEGRPVIVHPVHNDMVETFAHMLTEAGMKPDFVVDREFWDRHEDMAWVRSPENADWFDPEKHGPMVESGDANGLAREHLLHIQGEAGKEGRVTVAKGLGRGADIKIGSEVRERGGLRSVQLGLDSEAPAENEQRPARAARNGDPGDSYQADSLHNPMYTQTRDLGVQVAVVHYATTDRAVAEAASEHFEASARYDAARTPVAEETQAPAADTASERATATHALRAAERGLATARTQHAAATDDMVRKAEKAAEAQASLVRAQRRNASPHAPPVASTLASAAPVSDADRAETFHATTAEYADPAETAALPVAERTQRQEFFGKVARAYAAAQTGDTRAYATLAGLEAEAEADGWYSPAEGGWHISSAGQDIRTAQNVRTAPEIAPIQSAAEDAAAAREAVFSARLATTFQELPQILVAQQKSPATATLVLRQLTRLNQLSESRGSPGLLLGYAVGTMTWTRAWNQLSSLVTEPDAIAQLATPGGFSAAMETIGATGDERTRISVAAEELWSATASLQATDDLLTTLGVTTAEATPSARNGTDGTPGDDDPAQRGSAAGGEGSEEAMAASGTGGSGRGGDRLAGVGASESDGPIARLIAAEQAFALADKWMWERANVVAEYIEGWERPGDRTELFEWLRLASTDLRLWNRGDLERYLTGIRLDDRLRRDLRIALDRYRDAIAERARATEGRKAARDALGPVAEGVTVDCVGIGKWGAWEAALAARGQLVTQIVDAAGRRSIILAPHQLRTVTIATTLDSLDSTLGSDRDIDATRHLAELRLDYRTNEAVLEELRRLAREHDRRVASEGGEFGLRAAARVGRAEARATAATVRDLFEYSMDTLREWVSDSGRELVTAGNAMSICVELWRQFEAQGSAVPDAAWTTLRHLISQVPDFLVADAAERLFALRVDELNRRRGVMEQWPMLTWVQQWRVWAARLDGLRSEFDAAVAHVPQADSIMEVRESYGVRSREWLSDRYARLFAAGSVGGWPPSIQVDSMDELMALSRLLDLSVPVLARCAVESSADEIVRGSVGTARYWRHRDRRSASRTYPISGPRSPTSATQASVSAVQTEAERLLRGLPDIGWVGAWAYGEVMVTVIRPLRARRLLVHLGDRQSVMEVLPEVFEQHDMTRILRQRGSTRAVASAVVGVPNIGDEAEAIRAVIDVLDDLIVGDVGIEQESYSADNLRDPDHFGIELIVRDAPSHRVARAIGARYPALVSVSIDGPEPEAVGEAESGATSAGGDTGGPTAAWADTVGAGSGLESAGLAPYSPPGRSANTHGDGEPAPAAAEVAGAESDCTGTAQRWLVEYLYSIGADGGMIEVLPPPGLAGYDWPTAARANRNSPAEFPSLEAVLESLWEQRSASGRRGGAAIVHVEFDSRPYAHLVEVEIGRDAEDFASARAMAMRRLRERYPDDLFVLAWLDGMDVGSSQLEISGVWGYMWDAEGAARHAFDPEQDPQVFGQHAPLRPATGMPDGGAVGPPTDQLRFWARSDGTGVVLIEPQAIGAAVTSAGGTGWMPTETRSAAQIVEDRLHVGWIGGPLVYTLLDGFRTDGALTVTRSRDPAGRPVTTVVAPGGTAWFELHGRADAPAGFDGGLVLHLPVGPNTSHRILRERMFGLLAGVWGDTDPADVAGAAVALSVGRLLESESALGTVRVELATDDSGTGLCRIETQGIAGETPFVFRLRRRYDLLAPEGPQPQLFLEIEAPVGPGATDADAAALLRELTTTFRTLWHGREFASAMVAAPGMVAQAPGGDRRVAARVAVAGLSGQLRSQILAPAPDNGSVHPEPVLAQHDVDFRTSPVSSDTGVVVRWNHQDGTITRTGTRDDVLDDAGQPVAYMDRREIPIFGVISPIANWDTVQQALDDMMRDWPDPRERDRAESVALELCWYAREHGTGPLVITTVGLGGHWAVRMQMDVHDASRPILPTTYTYPTSWHLRDGSVAVVMASGSAELARILSGAPRTPAAPRVRTALPAQEAHRGGRGLWPENSIPAFARAIEMGADSLELDGQTTADGVIVITHGLDPGWTRDTQPVVPGDPKFPYVGKQVSDLTWAQIQTVDIGVGNSKFPEQQAIPGTTMPSLEQVCALVAGADRPVTVAYEAKIDPSFSDDQVRAHVVAVIEVMTRHGISYSLRSFDWRVLRFARELVPDVDRIALTSAAHTTDEWMGRGRGLSMSARARAAAAQARGRPRTPGGDLPARAKQAGATAIAPHHTMVTARFIHQAAAVGLPVMPWTVNDDADFRRLIALGVAAICTDYPDRLRALIAEYRDRATDQTVAAMRPWAVAEAELLSHGTVEGEQPFGAHDTYRIAFEDGTSGAYTPSGATSSAAKAQLHEPPSGLAARAVFVYRLAARLGIELVPPTALWTGSRGPGVLSLVDPEAGPGRPAREYRRPDRFLAAVFQFIIGETDSHIGNVLTRRGRPLLIDNKNTVPLGPESFAPDGFTSDIRSPFVDAIVGVRIPRSVLRVFDALTPEFIREVGAQLGVEPQALNHVIRRLSEVRATGRITPGMLATALGGQQVVSEPSPAQGLPMSVPATASGSLLEHDSQTDRILDPGSASADEGLAQRALDILVGDPESDAAQPDSPRANAVEVHRRWNMLLREQERLDRALILALLLLYPQHLADADIPDLIVRSDAIELRIERTLAERLTRPDARFGPLRRRQLVELVHLRNGVLRARQLARIGHPEAPEVQVVIWMADIEAVSGIRRVAYIFGDRATAAEVDWHFFGGRGGWGAIDTYLSRTRNRYVAMQRMNPDRRAIAVAWVYQTRSVGPGNARQALEMLRRDVERFAAAEAAIRGPAGVLPRNNLVLHRISPITAAEIDENGSVAAGFEEIITQDGPRRRARERMAAIGAGLAARVPRGSGLVVPPEASVPSPPSPAIRTPGSDAAGAADREPDDPDPLPRDPRTGMPIRPPVDDRMRTLAREVADGWPPTATRPPETVENRAQVRARVFAAAEYWYSLDKTHRTAALWYMPEWIVANLGAALKVTAPGVLDDASRLIIVERIRVLRALPTLNPDEATELHNHELTQQTLAQIDEMATAVHPAVPVPARYLIDYDPNAFGGKGRAVIVFRRPDLARPSDGRPESVSVYVPGVGTSLEKLTEKAEFARNQYESTMVGADDGFVATSVAWLGYDAPGTMKEGTNWRRARAGADRLQMFLFEYQAAQEFRASRARAAPAHIHLISHSYGSTTASFSGLGGAWERAVTTFTILGSPGAAAARHASDYGLEPGRVFAGGDWRDRVTWWSSKLPGQPGHPLYSAAVGIGAILLAGTARGSLGRDPLTEEFGAVRIRAGFPAGYGTPAEIHRGYLRFADPNTRTPTESLANTGCIARGDYDAVTLEDYRPASGGWSQRIEAWRTGDPAQRREVVIDDDTSGYDPPAVAGHLAHDPQFSWLPRLAPVTDADRRIAQAALAKRPRYGMRATMEDILDTESGSAADVRAKAIGNALWWAVLTPREMLGLVKLGAFHIANGPGLAIVAPQWTDFAARWHLQETLAALVARIAPGPQEIQYLTPDEQIVLRSLLRTRGALRRAAAVHPSVPTPAVHILAYDPRAFGGHGRLVMALGDPRTAKVRGRFVPGVRSEIRRFWNVWTGIRNLYEMSVQAGRRPEEFYCVVWYGYETPGGPGRSAREFAATTLTSGFARAGAALLTRDMLADNAAWLLDPEADAAATRVNIAHSYGSTTFGYAGAGGALADEFDYVVLIGSPGIPFANAAGFGLPPGRVLVGAFPNDPVTIAGADEPGNQTRWSHSRVGRLARQSRAGHPAEGPWGLGMDPTHEAWGARLFATDIPRDADAESPSHTHYFTFDGWYGIDSRRPILALWNMALLFAGRPDDISEAPHRTGVDDHGAHPLLDMSIQARRGFRRSSRWPEDPQRSHEAVASTRAVGRGEVVVRPVAALSAAAAGAVGEFLSARGGFDDAEIEDLRELAGALIAGSAGVADGDVVFFAQARPSGMIGGARLELGVCVGGTSGAGGSGQGGEDGSSGGDTGRGGSDAVLPEEVESGRSGETVGEASDDADVVESEDAESAAVEPARSGGTVGELSGDVEADAAEPDRRGENDDELADDTDVTPPAESDPFDEGEIADDTEDSGVHPSADTSWRRTVLPANRHADDADRARAVGLWTWVYIDTAGRWPTLSDVDVDLLVRGVPERICDNIHIPPSVRRTAYLLMLVRAMEELEQFGDTEPDTFEQADRLENLEARDLPTTAGALEIADGFAGIMSFYPQTAVLSLDIPVDGPSRRASIIGFGAVPARPMRPGDQLIVHVFGREPSRRNTAQQTDAARRGAGISGVDLIDAIARVADYHRTAAASSWNLDFTPRPGTMRPEPGRHVISAVWHAPGIAPDEAYRALASDLVSMVRAFSGAAAVAEGEIPEVVLVVHGPAVPSAMRAGARAQRAGVAVRIVSAGPRPLPALLSQPTRDPARARRIWSRLSQDVVSGMRAERPGGTDTPEFRASHTARRWQALDTSDREEVTWSAAAPVVATAGVDAQARDIAYRVSLEYERDRLRVVRATAGLSSEQQRTLVLLELRTALIEVIEGVAAGLPGHPKTLVVSREPVTRPERGLPLVMFDDADFVRRWVVFVVSSASVRDGIEMAAERYSAEPADDDGQPGLATITWSIPDGMPASEAVRHLAGDLVGLVMARATDDDPLAEAAMPEIRLVIDDSAAAIASEVRANPWLSAHATIAGHAEPSDDELRHRCLEFIRRVAEDLDIPPGHLDGGATVRELDAALPTTEVPRAYPFVPVALPTGADAARFFNVLDTVLADMVPDGTAADTVVLVTHRAGDMRNHIIALTVVDGHLFIADGGRRGGVFTYGHYWENTSPSELTEPPVILVLARYYLNGRPVEVPAESRATVDAGLLDRVRGYPIEGGSWASEPVGPPGDHPGRSVRWDPDTGAVTVTSTSGMIADGSPDSVAWVESAEIPIDRGLGQGAAAAEAANFAGTVSGPVESDLRLAILYCVREMVEYAHLYGVGPLVHTSLRLDAPGSGPQRAFALRLSDFGDDVTRMRGIALISQAVVRLHNGTLYVVVADSPELARVLLPVETGTGEPHPMVPGVGQAMDDLLHASGWHDEGVIVRLCTVATELVAPVTRRFPGAVVFDARALPAASSGIGSMRLGVRVEGSWSDSANYTGAAQDSLVRYLGSVGADGGGIDVLPPPGAAGYDWTVVARANRMAPEAFASFDHVLASLWEQRSASGRRGGAAMVHMEFESLGLANIIEVEIREQDGDFAAAREAAMWRLRENYPDDPLFAGAGWFVVSGVWAYVVDAEGAARHPFDPDREEPVSFGFPPTRPSS